MKKNRTSKWRWVTVSVLIAVILSVSVWSVKRERGLATVSIIGMEASASVDAAAEPSGELQERFSAASKHKVDFVVTSQGRGRLSTFNLSVWTTNGSRMDVGEFSFVLRQIEQIGAHDERTENYIDYIIPDTWNSSQQLTETVTVKEIQRNPVRALIANEPLFRRGVDYPASVPFDEIEIQVDGVNFYTDVNETEYLAWVRLRETETPWDIKQVLIEGWND